MEFRILGRLEVLADGDAPIAVTQPLIRSAICVLVLKADRLLTSAQLADLLWEPDGHLDRAGSVKTCLGGVRRVLSPDRLPSGRGGYRLRLEESDTVDLLMFHDLVDQAREA